MGGGGTLTPGGGGTLIFPYIRRRGSFLGAQNFDFQYFFGFSENKYFFWHEDFVDYFWVITKLDYIWGLFLCILGSFLKVQNGEIFWGLLKFRIFFFWGGCLKFLTFFFFGGGGGGEGWMLVPSLCMQKKLEYPPPGTLTWGVFKYTVFEGRNGSTPLWGVLFHHAKNIWEIWVSAQMSRSLCELLFSEASRYPGKSTNVHHHRDGEISDFPHIRLSTNTPL